MHVLHWVTIFPLAVHFEIYWSLVAFAKLHNTLYVSASSRKDLLFLGELSISLADSPYLRKVDQTWMRNPWDIGVAWHIAKALREADATHKIPRKAIHQAETNVVSDVCWAGYLQSSSTPLYFFCPQWYESRRHSESVCSAWEGAINVASDRWYRWHAGYCFVV